MQQELLQACASGNPEAVRALLQRGASAAFADDGGATALHYACRAGSLESVRHLLSSATCDIDAVDSQQHSAVYWACAAVSVDILQELRPSAQLRSLLSVNEVIASVEIWQKAKPSREKADVLAFLRTLHDELAAAEELRPAAAQAQQEQEQAPAADKSCCICLESITAKSISCSSSEHHICIVCLDSYVSAETSSSKQRIAANKGKLCCPGDGCSNVFEHHELAQYLPPETFGKLLAAWQACIEQAAMQTAAEQAKQELAREAAKDDVGKARAHVLDSILTLKCPRCHKAFDDFDGCFALHCSDEGGHGCGAAFCGYCLKDCGNSKQAHAHVAACPHNSARGRLFGSKEGFVAAQRSRRKRMVLEYLESLPLQLRERVKPAVAPDLKDLGIDLNPQQQQQLFKYPPGFLLERLPPLPPPPMAPLMPPLPPPPPPFPGLQNANYEDIQLQRQQRMQQMQQQLQRLQQQHQQLRVRQWAVPQPPAQPPAQPPFQIRALFQGVAAAGDAAAAQDGAERERLQAAAAAAEAAAAAAAEVVQLERRAEQRPDQAPRQTAAMRAASDAAIERARAQAELLQAQIRQRYQEGLQRANAVAAAAAAAEREGAAAQGAQAQGGGWNFAAFAQPH
jgi:Ankyrin repeats (3 copies)